MAKRSGEVHCNQPSQAGREAVLARNPPNTMKGRVKMGATEVAVVMSEQKHEMQRPTPIEI